MIFRIFPIALLTAFMAPPAGAADIEAGKQLVATHCYKCHGTEVYTRADRRVTTLPQLHSQVRRCELSLGLTWFDQDIENVADYLNKEFYRFK